jgi:hypothetical protein
MSHHCYADDTQVYLVVKPLDSWNNISQGLESCLSDIITWMCGNMLKLNEDKTELIIFAPKHWVKDLSNCHLSIEGNIISSAECIKKLGVYFDETLSMTKQVSVVSKSCFHQIWNIGRIHQYITENACRMLVCSLVTSRLDYGNALLYGLSTSIIQRLQRVQNTAARMITRQKKSDHITPVLHSLHWLPVSYQCQYKLLLYVFKALIQKASIYLQELIQVHKPSRSLRSGTRSLLTTPSVRTKTYGERRFDRAAAFLWNALPNEMRDTTQSVDVFKKKLRTHLFRQAFSIA